MMTKYGFITLQSKSEPNNNFTFSRKAYLEELRLTFVNPLTYPMEKSILLVLSYDDTFSITSVIRITFSLSLLHDDKQTSSSLYQFFHGGRFYGF